MNLFFLQVIIDSSKIKDSLARAGIIPAPGKQNLMGYSGKGRPADDSSGPVADHSRICISLNG